MKKLLLSACAAAACWMSDAGAMNEQDTDGKRVWIDKCSSGDFLIITRWGLGNIDTESYGKRCKCLHINYDTTEDRLREEEFKNNFTQETKDVLYKLPDFIENFTNLRVLEIYGLGCEYGGNILLKELPDSIGNLTNLVVLSVTGQLFSDIPSSVGNLKKLEELILHGNQIKALPDSIGKLINLEVLHLAGNKLQELPESIVNLKNLKKLNLNRNFDLYDVKKRDQKDSECFRVEGIPKKIHDFLENMENIGGLHLPEHLSINSFYLEVTGYHFSFILADDVEEYSPKSDVVLHKYRGVTENGRLFINCKIKPNGIPLDVSIAKDMRSLDARDVSVKKIPLSLSKLTELESLDLRDNPELTELPDFLWEMPGLRRLSVDGPLKRFIPTNRVILDEKISNNKIIRLICAWKNHEKWSDKKLMEILDIKNPIHLAPLAEN